MTRLKVHIINDLSPEHPAAGGAERSLQGFVDQSPSWVSYVEDCNQDGVLYLINNFRGQTPERLEAICSNHPYIVYWRDALDVPFFTDAVKKLMSNALLNITLSPLHRERLELNYGNDWNVIIEPPHMDLSGYTQQKDTQRLTENFLWVGKIYMHKGIEEVLLQMRANECIVDVYGDGDPLLVAQIHHSNYANYMGRKAPDELKTVFKTYTRFIHLPEQTEAFGRSVAEAFFSGCELALNPNVGFASYDWPYDLEFWREKIEQSPQRIWRQIEQYL